MTGIGARHRSGERPGDAGAQRGSAAAVMVMVVAMAVLAVTSIGLLSAASLTRARAGTAADAAALAAAVVSQHSGNGCAAAARVAAVHRAIVRSCTTGPAGAVVAVSVPLHMGAGNYVRTFDVNARARAGPAPPP